MAKLNLSQAAKTTGKNRTTIWRHIKSGKLSAQNGTDGLPYVDTSELLRVYGELKTDATPATPELQHYATPLYQDLIDTIEMLRKEQAEMREQLANLTNRLTYTPPVSPKKPEDDPRWPQEVKTTADLALRNEIRREYLKSDQ